MAISLQKGQKISLEKSNGSNLEQICVGVNWGALEKKGLFGGIKKVAVDLDASCIVFDANNEVIDTVYFGKLETQGIKHSGDDRTGDLDGDDGLDNEIITLNLKGLNNKAHQIAFVLNSYSGHDFKTIPFASIRLYEGTPTRVNNVYATYDVTNDPQFSGALSMVLGKFYLHNTNWKFSALGEPTKDSKLPGMIETVKRHYL
ncbi:MAG TPA: TerD family protein [Psychromonas sp.]